MLTQGKDDNEAGREKDKQETANFIDREYITVFTGYQYKPPNIRVYGWFAWIARIERRLVRNENGNC